jgi:hypothetical protein
MTAFAADSGTTPNNVTITVVMPETTPLEAEAEPTPEPVTYTPTITLYPVDVAENFAGNRRQIVKTYELSPLENPADIPRADFERNGWLYSVTDILKRETANAETREHTETVTLNTDTKELEKIMTLLAPTMEYRTEDEFVGILALDVASIKVETAGTKTTTYEMKVTREYPHLSTNDTSLVPKTVTDNGKTYTLANVDWKVGNYSTVDYEQIPDYYDAVATYTATGSSTKVTGYVTTAQYVGTLAKLSEGKTVYTAYFEGTEIRTPLEITELPMTVTDPESADEPAEIVPTPTDEPADVTPEPTDEPTQEPHTGTSDKHTGGGTISNILIAVLAALCGALFYFYNKIRRNATYAKTNHNTSDADDDSDADDSGIRS